MTVVRSLHERFNATFESADGRSFPAHYGRPERTHRAVRNGVGVTELDYGVLVVEGPERVAALDDRLTNRVPDADGEACYGFALTEGRVAADCYAFNAGERLLAFLPPAASDGLRASLADGDGATVRDATGDFGVFGVHGPRATEKVASVLNGASTPDERLSFVRGRINDEGVTVVRGDGVLGEEGYTVVCGVAAAETVFDALISFGVHAVPFGRRTWSTLSLEAGTPLFEADLSGRPPAELGVAAAYPDGETPTWSEERRLVGLRPETVPEAGADVVAGGETVGTVTRAARSPLLEAPICLAVVDCGATDLTVDGVPAEYEALPFVESGERSGRVPTWS